MNSVAFARCGPVVGRCITAWLFGALTSGSGCSSVNVVDDGVEAAKGLLSVESGVLEMALIIRCKDTISGTTSNKTLHLKDSLLAGRVPASCRYGIGFQRPRKREKRVKWRKNVVVGEQ